MVTFHDNIYPHYSASDDPRAFTLTPKQQLHYSMCTDFSPTLLGEEKMHMVRPLKVRGVSGRLVEILLLSFLSLLGILDPWKERTNELERPDIHGYFHTFSSILAWSTLLGEQIWIFLGVNMISFVCWVGWVRASCATCRPQLLVEYLCRSCTVHIHEISSLLILRFSRYIRHRD